ncbi:MAG TPA: DUF1731 domain-containing protein [Thermoanaerobaculia bacterium]
MKIVIPGGSGHLGSLLARNFRDQGHDVSILSRTLDARAGVRDARWQGIRIVQWDGRTRGSWVGEIDGADVVINLAGRSVDCRYDDETRAEIMDSRVESARIVGDAIARATFPPRLWLQMSTATIYAHRYDSADEQTPIVDEADPHWQFSIDVARAWELALDDADAPHTRKVALRTAMVMSADEGGAFELLRRHVRMGFGRFGDGRQYMSWIHERDFVRAVEFLIANEVAGPVNLASPYPLPNEEFMHILSNAVGGRFGIPSSGWLLELGACIFRTEPELVLKSRNVVPARLLDAGFRFELPLWQDAVEELALREEGALATW